MAVISKAVSSKSVIGKTVISKDDLKLIIRRCYETNENNLPKRNLITPGFAYKLICI